jgi:sarcosine oxidase delta subunit
MTEITKYMDMARDIRSEDKERDLLFAGIDDMWHGTWSLPEELKNKPDMREIIDLSPHDALKSGTAIMSTSLPHWIVQPLASNQGEQDRAEKIAYAIDYNYKRMNQRGSSTILWDMVHSCLRYDAVAIWLDYLPYKFKNNPTLRQKHALRGGDFAVKVHNPRNVHIQSDTFGTNKVLLTVNLPAQEVANMWGMRALQLAARLKKDEDTGTTRFIYNDLILYEGNIVKRVVWGSITEGLGVEGGSDEFVIMNEKMEIPFVPWIVRVGGSGLESSSKYSVHPLLAPLYHTHKWKDLNVFQSIMQSEVIKLGRTPRVVTTTPSGDGVDIDYENGTTVNLRTGEEATAWKPSAIDSNLKELVDRVRAEVSSATLPRILQNPEFAGNTPFASINAMIQTALGGLNPAKTLCESAHEELALKMIEWCKFMGKPLLAYRTKKTMKEGMDNGSFVNVGPEELDPDSLIISCKLFAEAPTDFNQRVDVGLKLNQYLKIPRSEILGRLGYENVDSLYDQYIQEQYDDSAVALDIQTTQAQAQMQLQMAAQQAQMQAQQQTQGQQMPQESGGVPGEGLNLNTGLPQGANSNLGASNPATGNPGVGLREQISGQDITGNAIA